jgi:hypothetical protein
VKTQAELQRAHDILSAVVLEEVKLDTLHETTSWTALHAGLDVLCWALGHSDNKAFGVNLAHVENALAKAGYRLVEQPIDTKLRAVKQVIDRFEYP